MKLRISFPLLLAGIAISSLPVRADFIANAVLTGSQEVPPTGSAATATAVLTYNSVAQDLLYSVVFQNLTSPATASHIHFGALGTKGPVIFPFTSPGPPSATSGMFNGTLTAADFHPDAADGINTFAEAIAAIQAGDTYVNIHSSTFPAGEIRGQVALTPEPATFGVVATVMALGLFVRRRRTGRQS